MVEKKTKIQKVAERWDNLDHWVKRVLGLFATIGTIAGMFIGVMSWFTAQLDGYLDVKLDALTTEVQELRSESEAGDRALQLSNTRLELNHLISSSPENVLEIERVAKYYFVTLGGDWYMSNIYSKWAKAYGGDTSFVTD